MMDNPHFSMISSSLLFLRYAEYKEKTWLILNQKGSQVHFEKETKSRINCNHLFVSTDIQGQSEVYYYANILSLLVEALAVTPCNQQINE